MKASLFVLILLVFNRHRIFCHGGKSKTLFPSFLVKGGQTLPVMVKPTGPSEVTWSCFLSHR